MQRQHLQLLLLVRPPLPKQRLRQRRSADGTMQVLLRLLLLGRAKSGLGRRHQEDLTQPLAVSTPRQVASMQLLGVLMPLLAAQWAQHLGALMQHLVGLMPRRADLMPLLVVSMQPRADLMQRLVGLMQPRDDSTPPQGVRQGLLGGMVASHDGMQRQRGTEPPAPQTRKRRAAGLRRRRPWGRLLRGRSDLAGTRHPWWGRARLLPPPVRPPWGRVPEAGTPWPMRTADP